MIFKISAKCGKMHSILCKILLVLHISSPIEPVNCIVHKICLHVWAFTWWPYHMDKYSPPPRSKSTYQAGFLSQVTYCQLQTDSGFINLHICIRSCRNSAYGLLHTWAATYKCLYIFSLESPWNPRSIRHIIILYHNHWSSFTHSKG